MGMPRILPGDVVRLATGGSYRVVGMSADGLVVLYRRPGARPVRRVLHPDEWCGVVAEGVSDWPEHELGGES